MAMIAEVDVQYLLQCKPDKEGHGATSEHRLQAVLLGVGVVVGLAVLEFHQLQAVRSDDRDRRSSRSPAAT